MFTLISPYQGLINVNIPPFRHSLRHRILHLRQQDLLKPVNFKICEVDWSK